MLRQGNVLEYDEYCGSFYGTREQVFQHLNEGKDVLLDLTASVRFRYVRNVRMPSLYSSCLRLYRAGVPFYATETEDVAHRVETAKQTSYGC